MKTLVLLTVMSLTSWTGIFAQQTPSSDPSGSLSGDTVATYLYDDGRSEYARSSVYQGRLVEALWFTQFTAVPGAQTIVSVDIAWGTPNNHTPAKRLNGIPVTIGIWSDPNRDGDPSDAVLLSSVPGTIELANTDTFVTYTFPVPVTVTTDSFFVGHSSPGEEHFAQQSSRSRSAFEGQDTTNPVGRSWYATMRGAPVDFTHLGANQYLMTTEQLGLPGNWMIRANADGPSF